MLKLSDEELQVIAAMFSLGGSDEAMLKELIVRHCLDLAVLTRGPEGCLLLSHDEIVNLPGIPSSIVDTIGAGDAFTAATALGKLLGRPLAAIADHANQLAANVCTCQGGHAAHSKRADTVVTKSAMFNILAHYFGGLKLLSFISLKMEYI